MYSVEQETELLLKQGHSPQRNAKKDKSNNFRILRTNFITFVSFNWGIQWSPNTIKSSLFRLLRAIVDICRAALGIL